MKTLPPGVRLTLLFIVALSVHPALAQTRPNILLILSDDQRADAVGASGNPYVHTPALDGLAHRGVTLTNAYCMGSHVGAVCAPSRAMLMSGRSLFHVYDTLAGVPTLPQTLRDNGYLTFGTGKWHNERSAFRDGFTLGKTIFFGGMSDHYQVPVVDLLPDGSFSEDSLRGFSTNVFTESALAFLEDYATGEQKQPFFAYVAYTAPHDPRSPAPDYIDRYTPEQLPLPPNFVGAHPFDLGVMTIRDENLGAWPRSAEQIRMQLADYYGLVTHLDARIGDLLRALEDHDLADNTIVVFTSDHGLAIGSHGLLGKQSLYEESMHAPLILAGPGLAGRHSARPGLARPGLARPGLPEQQTHDALVYLYDLLPTLCGLVDVAPPSGIDGHDLSPIIRGEVPEVRNILFTTYSTTQRAVKNHRWKLIRYPTINHTQLFDLRNDPFELHNLADDTTYQAAHDRLWSELERQQQLVGDTLPLRVANPTSMEYDLSNYDRRPDRHQPEYTLRKYFEETAPLK